MSSLSNGFLEAKLVDETTPQTSEFCIEVSSSLHSVTIPDLEFVLEANCKKALSKVLTSTLSIEQMFNNT